MQCPTLSVPVAFRHGFALVALTIFVTTSQLSGAPIFGELLTFRQPDGSEVKLILNGDEFYLRAETPEGFTVVRDSETGWICYARLAEGSDELISTGVPCRGTETQSTIAQLQAAGSIPAERHLDLKPASRSLKSKAVRSALWGDHAAVVEGASAATRSGVTPQAGGPVANGITELPPRKSNVAKYTGTVRGLVLIVDFPDAPAGASPTFQEFVNSVNQPNFHKPDGRPNSLRTFFEDVSGGVFIVSNFVFGIYRATNTFAYYDSIGYGSGAQQLMGFALQQIEASGFDFSQLTVDGNNEVESLCIMYTGSPQTWAQGMWYHSGWWGSGPTYDGVTFRQYCTTTTSTDPGTLIHENGHMIADWPDLYSYNGAATGTWDVMGGGWTDLPNPYLLYQNGWLDAVNIAEDYGLRVMNSLDAHNALVFYDPVQPEEFYFIRPYTKNVLYCPGIPDEGLALWRINLKGANSDYPNTPLEMELIHVNGVVANASANVLFKAAGRNRYTDTTAPGSYWAYHHRKGQRSGLNLTAISAPGNTMTFRVSRPIYFYPVPTQVTALGGAVNLKVTATSDLPLTYSASSLPPGLSLNPTTGVITGNANSLGGYQVLLTATDTEGSQNTFEFSWLIGTGASTPPAAWYAFQGNLLDSSGNGRHGAAVGTPLFTNNTVQFNGNNSAATIPRAISDNFTIAFFIKAGTSANSGNQWWQGAGLVDGEVGGATHDFGVSLTGDQVAFGVGSPGNDVTIQSVRSVTDGQWHHVAATRTAANGAMALYIDGTLDATGTGSTGSKTAPPSLRIGSLQTAINYFNGQLDEVRLYASAIPAEEIYRLSTNRAQLLPVANQVTLVNTPANVPVPKKSGATLIFSATGLPSGTTINAVSGIIAGTPTVAGIYDVVVKATSVQGPEGIAQFSWAVCSTFANSAPVASYPLVSNFNDVSGFNRHGVGFGSPTFATPAVWLDGVDDVVRIPRPISTDFTISFFLNAAVAGGGGNQWWQGDGLVDGEVGGATHDFGVSLVGDKIAFGVGSPGGDTTIQSTSNVTDRAWHHVAVTRSSTSGAIAIYLDGRLNQTGTASTGAKTSPPFLRIGSLQTAINYFSGGIAEVKLYGQVLSAEEIFRQSQLLPADPGYSITHTSWSLPAGGNLTWNTAPGEFYQVEWTAGLGQAFAPLGAPTPANSAFSVSRSITAPGTNGFYRIRRL